ncbi:hypothetical protein RUND412_010928, partial [Rhizina undulata]
MSAEYCCIFGISEPVDGYLEGNGDTMSNDSFSILTGTGLGGRLFWFVFIKMEKKYYAPNIPRFTKADCEKMAQKFFKAKITDTLTFEDIWKNRISDTLTSLEERVHTKWHFGRMVTIGDSAHKVTACKSRHDR